MCIVLNYFSECSQVNHLKKELVDENDHSDFFYLFEIISVLGFLQDIVNFLYALHSSIQCILYRLITI